MINRKQLIFLADEICKKIDHQTEAFMQRTHALCKDDLKKVKYIEEMVIKPIEYQIQYLANELEKTTKGEHYE